MSDDEYYEYELDLEVGLLLDICGEYGCDDGCPGHCPRCYDPIDYCIGHCYG